MGLKSAQAEADNARESSGTNTQRLGAGRVAESTPSILAKCERRPQWVCFSIRTRSSFTACEAEGSRSHPSVHATVSIPLAEIQLLGHMAFPATLLLPQDSPLSFSSWELLSAN